MQRFSSGLESKGDREASLQKMTGRLSREGTLVSVGLFPPFFQSTKSRTSLAAGWLRLCAPNAGGPGSLPGWATRSCMPQLRPDAAIHTHTHTDPDTHTHTHRVPSSAEGAFLLFNLCPELHSKWTFLPHHSSSVTTPFPALGSGLSGSETSQVAQW